MEKVAGTLDTWEYEWTYPQLRHNKLVDLVGKISSPFSDSLLDVGCGNCHLTKKLMEAMNIRTAWGVDILADKLLAPPGVGICQVDVDKDILPFEDEYFNLVCCSDIIEHLSNPDLLLSEVYRVLKPKGKCVITTPNLASWGNRIALSLGYQPFSTSVSMQNEWVGKMIIDKGFHGQWGHMRVFTLKALEQLVKLHGFKVLGVHGWPIGDFSIHMKSKTLSLVTRLVDSIFSTRPSLASRIVVVVQK